MTRTLILTNHKGGVGKSTSVANIAFGLVNILRSAGAANPRVLLVDTDSQGHATLVTSGTKVCGTDHSLNSCADGGSERCDARDGGVYQIK